jgi:hypothetical protein
MGAISVWFAARRQRPGEKCLLERSTFVLIIMFKNWDNILTIHYPK